MVASAIVPVEVAGDVHDVKPKEPMKKRMTYDSDFKKHVVEMALQRPPDNRIKPTCALFPGIEPCQVCQPAWHEHPPNLHVVLRVLGHI